MRTQSRLVQAILLVFVLLVPASLANANLIVNPGFESGNFTGWTQGGNTGYTGVSFLAEHTGTYGAAFGAVGSSGSVSQALATTIGQTYGVSFWLRNLSSNPPNFFAVSFGGSTLLSLSNATAFGYTQYSFTVLATSVSSVLQFQFRHDPSYWLLDDISVVAQGPVSVPDAGASALLLSIGLLALLFAQRTHRISRTHAPGESA